MKNAGKACNNRLYRHIRTFEKIVKNYFVIYHYIRGCFFYCPALPVLFTLSESIFIISEGTSRNVSS